MAFTTPEQRAIAAQEEAQLAIKHGHVADDQKKKTANQVKNGKYYAKEVAEMKAKTGRAGRVRTFRKCAAGEDPKKYSLKDINNITYMSVQYFINTGSSTRTTKDGVVLACGSGKAGHTLKINWSTQDDPRKAKMPEYQTETYYNLYTGYSIAASVKQFGKEFVKQIKENTKYYKEHAEMNEANPLTSVMYGQCTVQVEKGGTQKLPEFNVWFIPIEKDEKCKGMLVFNSNGVEHHVLMHDVSKRENKNGSKRADNASKMIGFLPKISSTKSNEILVESLTKLKNKDA